MISDKYLWRERVRISDRKVESAEAVIPVRRRFMKAVFFFKAESNDLLTAKRSAVLIISYELSVSEYAWGDVPPSPDHARSFRSRSSPADFPVTILV